MKKKELCVFCSGDVKNKNVRVSRESDDGIVIFENVPAEVCSKCGEQYFSLEVMKNMEEQMKKKERPEKMLKVPIYVMQ